MIGTTAFDVWKLGEKCIFQVHDEISVPFFVGRDCTTVPERTPHVITPVSIISGPRGCGKTTLLMCESSNPTERETRIFIHQPHQRKYCLDLARRLSYYPHLASSEDRHRITTCIAEKAYIDNFPLLHESMKLEKSEANPLLSFIIRNMAWSMTFGRFFEEITIACL